MLAEFGPDQVVDSTRIEGSRIVEIDEDHVEVVECSRVGPRPVMDRHDSIIAAMVRVEIGRSAS